MLHQRIDEAKVEVFQEERDRAHRTCGGGASPTRCATSGTSAKTERTATWSSGYTSSEAFLLHQTHLKEIPRTGPSVGPIMEVVVLGSPSAELREQFAQRGARVFPLLVGCTR